MATLINFWSPHNSGAIANNSKNKAKPKTSSSNMRQSGSSRELAKGDEVSSPRVAKRKAARRDPYQELAGTEEDVDDDDGVLPAPATPSSQRTDPSRMSSVTPGSTTKPRHSLTNKRGIARPLKKKSHVSETPRVTNNTAAIATVATAVPPGSNKKPNVTRAKPADTRRTQQPDSIAPEAPMGGLGFLAHNATRAPAASPTKLRIRDLINNTPPLKGKGKETEAAKKTIMMDDNEDPRDEKEVAKLLQHRMARDQSGAVELLVLWAGEDEQDATWEAESEIQEGAGELLYSYWRTQGGRINALFHKPRNPPAEMYLVFKVLRHEKRSRGGGFQFEVQWVGHPSTRGETSMESETKLRAIAPDLLAAYWDSVGGRASFLAPRGRAKKPRTE